MSMASPTPVRQKRRRFRYLRADVLTLLLFFGLMSAVYLLPADTSLALVQKGGTLKVCVPASYPPLVTGNAADPGFDISLMQAVAEKLGLKLALNANPNMGKDFNPRNWHVTRAQCEVLAGGVLTSRTTQSFLETLSTGVATGWAVIQKPGTTLARGSRIGVYPGLGGLDRLGLSTFLRAQGVQGALRPSLAALEAGLESGEIDAAATEALGAGKLIVDHPDWTISWLPEDLGRATLGIGLWKGDLTLKRAIIAAIDELERDGTIAQLQQRYGIVPIDAVASFAP